MRRVVSLFLPTWPTDRIRRRFGNPPKNKPLVTIAVAGSRRVIASADDAAQELGLRKGMAIAQAQALVPDLHTFDATPDEDEASLRELARWSIRYSPVVSPDPPDGIWIDIAGVAHLFGSEDDLLKDLIDRLTRNGLKAQVAVADAPGAAWAMARYGRTTIIPPGRTVDAVAGLNVQALRLTADALSAMNKLGIDRIGQLASMPRAPMVRRFGKDVALRLDQVMGHVFEPITPLIPEEAPIATVAFSEPIGRLDDIRSVVYGLAEDLCRTLTRRSVGVRRLDLVLRRVDEKGASLRVGTAKANRDPVHLARLFDDRLETIDPGFGIEEVVMIASRTERLLERQAEVQGFGSETHDVDMSRLVDRLSARVGSGKVYRLAPVQTLVPERMAKRIPALSPTTGASWPENLPRPSRLLDPPEPLVATALLPDHPPAFFIWRHVRHKVVRSDGPERITSEWWLGSEQKTVRDYYRLETDQGGRYWVFRDAPVIEGGRWWLHGMLG